MPDMFGRKRAPKEAPQQQPQSAPRTSAGGYEITELPTFHGRHRKIVVYTSDANGKIVKTYRR